MRISVIIPCHNAEAWLAQTLESVWAQQLQPLETIVIDDGSNDESCRIASSFGSRVKLLKCSARNAATARNIGIRAARGDWIAFLDADDIWEPEHLSGAAKILGADDVAYMANHVWLSGNKTEPIPEGNRPKISGDHSSLTHWRFTELMSQGFHFGHSTVMVKRARLDDVGLFDETQVRRHDIDLWLRVVAGQTWSWGGHVAAQYRIDSPGSISKSVVSAEYYWLKALLKNQASYDHPPMKQLICTAARRGTSLAFVDGDREDFDRIRPLAWPHLSKVMRFCYAGAGVCPFPLRLLIRSKRFIWQKWKSIA